MRIKITIRAILFLGLSMLILNTRGVVFAQDVNENGVIDQDDVTALTQHFGETVGDASFVPELDLDNDGQIGFADFINLVDNIGRSPNQLIIGTPSTEGSNASAVSSLDFVGIGSVSGNGIDDQVISGTVTGSGTVVVVEVFAANLSTSLAGANITFDNNTSQITLTSVTSPFPFSIPSNNGVALAAIAPITPSNGLLATIEFTTQTDLSSQQFTLGLQELVLSASTTDQDTLSQGSLIFNASQAPNSTLFGSSRDGDLFTLNLTTGVGTSVGTLPYAVTEIEFDKTTGKAFAQRSDGAFSGFFFNINTSAINGSLITNEAEFAGLEYVGATLYGTAWPGASSDLKILNPATGTSTLVGATGVNQISGLAYDATNEIMYGIRGGSSNSDLLTLNLSTGTATIIGATGIRAGSLQFGPDGVLYAGGTGSTDGGKLFSINPATGQSTLIGLTGFTTVTGLTLVLTAAGTNISATPPTLDFGSVTLNLTQDRVLTITNNSTTDPLVIAEIATTGTTISSLTSLLIDDVSTTTIPVFDLPALAFTSAMTLSALEDTSITVRFAPVAEVNYSDEILITSNDPTQPLLTIPVVGTGILTPEIDISPTSLTYNLIQGASDTQTLVINNTGLASLSFQIAGAQQQSSASLGSPSDSVIVLEKGEIDTRQGPPVTAGFGGPDSTGYVWTDSDQTNGPTFGWVDISTVGTQITFSSTIDGNSGPFAIEFPFSFYGTSFDSFRVGTNGFISFTSFSTAYTNLELPSASAPGNLLAVFWDDLDVTNGQVFYHFDGSRLIVQYKDVVRYSTSDTFSFEAILYPNGKIIYQYLTVSNTTTTGCTVGIQNASGNDGLTVAFNTAYLSDNLAIRFTPSTNFLSASPLSGTVAPGASTNISITANAEGLLSDVFDGILTITSNDPDEATITIPVDLTVTSAPDISVSVASVDFGQVFTGTTSPSTTIQITNLGSDPLVISGIATGNNAVFTPSLSTVTLATDASQNVGLTFTPSALGIQQDNLSITSNDPDEALVQISLQGEGVLPPAISINPTQFDLTLPAGDVSNLTLSVSNIGASGAPNLIVGVGENLVTALTTNTEPTSQSYQEQRTSTLPMPLVPRALGSSLAQKHREGTIYSGFSRHNRSLNKATTNTLPAVPFVGPFSTTPYSMAFDSAGNLFVALSSTGEVKKVLSDGTMTTYATGLGFSPLGMAFDDNGDLYVGDNSSGTIYKVTSTSLGATIDVTVAPFTSISGYPVGLAFDDKGDLFIADENSSNPTIWKVAIGTASTPGSAVVVTPFVTGLPGAFGLARDASGNFLVTTSSAGTVEKIDPQGNVTTLITDTAFLEGIAIDVDGKVYVGNGFLGTLKRYNPDGTFESDLSTTEVSGFPISMAFGPNFGLSGQDNTVLFVGNGTDNSIPFNRQVVQFDVGVAGLSLPPDAVPWLTLSPENLIIPVGQDAPVTATVNSARLTAGTHQAEITLSSNDPIQPVLQVPVNLTVTSAPGISVSPGSLDFGELFLLASTTLTLVVQNVGTELLSISDIPGSLPDFIATPPSFNITPGSSQLVIVTFAPVATGARNATLSISSNDPTDPVVPITVSGIGNAGPDITLNTSTLDVTLASNGKTTTSITLSNAGGLGAAELNFNASIVYSVAAPTSTSLANIASSAPLTPVQATGAPYVSDEILVKFVPNIQNSYVQNVNNALGTRTLQVFSQIDVHHIKIESGAGADGILDAYRNTSAVVYAEPNYIVQAIAFPEDPPDDARFGEQWALNNTGQTSGTIDADVDGPEAWERSLGSEIIVGVIDTGVDLDHEDLAANIWTNAAELGGTPGVDDDNNGYIDDINGWDFANNDNDPNDDESHGTHVAGTIAAVGNNSIGVIGVSPNAKIMALKFLDSSGSGLTSDAILAIEYATANGAHITNNSWGGGGFSQALLDAIENANAAGALFIAAAGNDGTDNDITPHYPSSYNAPNIISVASTDHNDALSSFSNFGATSVDLAAPGSSILSTLPNDTYGLLNGTSMATPHVTGVAALLYSLSLASQTSQTNAGIHLTVKSQLLTSVDILSPLSNLMVTGGRLNAFTTLTTQWLSLGVLSGTIPSGSSVTIPVTFDAAGVTLPTEGASLVFSSNDPDEGTFTLPVTLHVAPTSDITGTVHYYDASTVKVDGVDVTLAPDGTASVSDANGAFIFSSILPGNYTITMSKSADGRNAIQGSDALTILQKTAFLLPGVLSADQTVAGDVNTDGFVDNTDAMAILRYLAFLDTGIGQTGNWNFLPDQITVTSGGVVPDIQAFLLGDVNPDWARAPLVKPTRVFPLRVDAATWKGDQLALPILIQGQGNLGSLLLSLEYDPGLFRYEATQLTDSGRGYFLVDNGQKEGVIHIALAGQPQTETSDPIFDLILHKLAPIEGGPRFVDDAQLTLTRLVVNDVVFPLDVGSILRIARIPEEFELSQNYPNPFNPETQIRFGLSEATQVRLAIYNALGQEVSVLIDEEMAPGFYTVPWNGLTTGGDQTASGVYIYHLTTSSGFTDTRRMLLLK